MDIIDLKTLEPCWRVSLPMDLILSCILPKLPAKSLLRFKCVSKSFLSEISSPEFNATFSEANHLLVLPGKNKPFRIFKLNSENSPAMICPYPIPPQMFPSEFTSIVACYKSYLLIIRSGIRGDFDGSLILLNPTTRIYRVIPGVHVPNKKDYIQYGMCQCLDDNFNDDLKIVRFLQYRRYVRDIIVYSLSTNSWKRIEHERTKFQCIDRPVLVQNHLLVMIFYAGNFDFTRIGCFDIKAERWSNDVLLPDIVLGEIDSNSTQNNEWDNYHLGVLDGRLRFSCYNEINSTYSVWVMKDYGVKESWVKLMSLPGHVYHPIAYRQGSSDELLCIPKYEGKYLWYNIKDKQFTETKFDGKGVFWFYNYFAYICKGSLLNFPGGQPIRSSSKKLVDDDDDDDEDDYDYNDDGYDYNDVDCYDFYSDQDDDYLRW